MMRMVHVVAIAVATSFGGAAALAHPAAFRVQSAVVEKDGQWREASPNYQTREDCARFRVSNTAATRWFAKAKEVGSRVWYEELEWTQCSAEGTLTTHTGQTYSWRLDQSGRGSIEITPDVRVYLSGKELPFAKQR